jgi:hypothetical protein
VIGPILFNEAGAIKSARVDELSSGEKWGLLKKLVDAECRAGTLALAGDPVRSALNRSTMRVAAKGVICGRHAVEGELEPRLPRSPLAYLQEPIPHGAPSGRG